MANINGLTLKALKVFRGHEGEPLAQGNVYFNGKKLGFWSQDAWGGPDRFDFDESLLDNLVEQYKKSDKVEPKYKDIFNLSCLLYDLLCLIDDEKDYKKCVKAGFPILLITDLFGNCKEWFILNEAVLGKKVEEVKKSYKQNENLKIKVYKKLSDFEITI